MSKQQLINKSNVQKVGVKFYKYKKIYLVVIGSIIQADGVLFEGQAEVKEKANDLNVTEHYRVQISTFTVVYETLIMTNRKWAVPIRIHLAMRVV